VISQRLAANAGAFVAAVLFGSSVVAVRVAVQEVPPLSLAVLRFGQGGLLLVVVLLLAGMREVLRVKWHDLPLLILLGAVLFTVFPVTFNASLRLIEASRGALGFGHYTTLERIAGSDGPERTFGASAGRWGLSVVGA
jgi:drug/metabolite transporter (DMT)-like permease